MICGIRLADRGGYDLSHPGGSFSRIALAIGHRCGSGWPRRPTRELVAAVLMLGLLPLTGIGNCRRGRCGGVRWWLLLVALAVLPRAEGLLPVW